MRACGHALNMYELTDSLLAVYGRYVAYLGSGGYELRVGPERIRSVPQVPP